MYGRPTILMRGCTVAGQPRLYTDESRRRPSMNHPGNFVYSGRASLAQSMPKAPGWFIDGLRLDSSVYSLGHPHRASTDQNARSSIHSPILRKSVLRGIRHVGPSRRHCTRPRGLAPLANTSSVAWTLVNGHAHRRATAPCR